MHKLIPFFLLCSKFHLVIVHRRMVNMKLRAFYVNNLLCFFCFVSMPKRNGNSCTLYFIFAPFLFDYRELIRWLTPFSVTRRQKECNSKKVRSEKKKKSQNEFSIFKWYSSKKVKMISKSCDFVTWIFKWRRDLGRLYALCYFFFLMKMWKINMTSRFIVYIGYFSLLLLPQWVCVATYDTRKFVASDTHFWWKSVNKITL